VLCPEKISGPNFISGPPTWPEIKVQVRSSAVKKKKNLKSSSEFFLTILVDVKKINHANKCKKKSIFFKMSFWALYVKILIEYNAN
jgi:hypothetical protein